MSEYGASAADTAAAPPYGDAVLVACAHGTRSERGRRAVARLVAAVATAGSAERGERGERGDGGVARVVAAYVDVQQPTPSGVLAAASGPAVLVPLLLSAGYHVQVDLARAARTAPVAAVVAPPLGPDDLLVAPLVRAVAGAVAGGELGGADDVRLVAAGSSRAASAADVQEMARRVGATLAREVRPAYLSADEPRIAAVVAANRAGGRRTVAISYLLSPGHFQDRLAASGADVVTAPLLDPEGEPPAELVRLVLARYAEAAARLGR